MAPSQVVVKWQVGPLGVEGGGSRLKYDRLHEEDEDLSLDAAEEEDRAEPGLADALVHFTPYDPPSKVVRCLIRGAAEPRWRRRWRKGKQPPSPNSKTPCARRDLMYA